MNKSYLSDYELTSDFDDNKTKRYVPIEAPGIFATGVTVASHKSYFSFIGYDDIGSQIWCVNIDFTLNLADGVNIERGTHIGYIGHFNSGWTTSSSVTHKYDNKFVMKGDNLVSLTMRNGTDELYVSTQESLSRFYSGPVQRFRGHYYFSTNIIDQGKVYETGRITNRNMIGPRMTLPVNGHDPQQGVWYGIDQLAEGYNPGNRYAFVYLYPLGGHDGARIYGVAWWSFVSCILGTQNSDIHAELRYYLPGYVQAYETYQQMYMHNNDLAHPWSANMGFYKISEDYSINKLDDKTLSTYDDNIQASSEQIYSATSVIPDTEKVYLSNLRSLGSEAAGRCQLAGDTSGAERPSKGYLFMLFNSDKHDYYAAGGSGRDWNNYNLSIMNAAINGQSWGITLGMKFQNPYIKYMDKKYVETIIPENYFPVTIANPGKMTPDGLDYITTFDIPLTKTLIGDLSDITQYMHLTSAEKIYFMIGSCSNYNATTVNPTIGSFKIKTNTTYTFSCDIKGDLNKIIRLNLKFSINNTETSDRDLTKDITLTGEWQHVSITNTNLTGFYAVMTFNSINNDITELSIKNLCFNQGQKTQYFSSNLEDTGWCNPKSLDVWYGDLTNIYSTVDLSTVESTDPRGDFTVLNDTSRDYVHIGSTGSPTPNQYGAAFRFYNWDLPEDYLTKVKNKIISVYNLSAWGKSIETNPIQLESNASSINNHRNNPTNTSGSIIPVIPGGYSTYYNDTYNYKYSADTTSTEGTLAHTIKYDVIEDTYPSYAKCVNLQTINDYGEINNILIKEPDNLSITMRGHSGSDDNNCYFGPSYNKLRVIYSKSKLSIWDTELTIDTLNYNSADNITVIGSLKDETGSPLFDEEILFINDKKIIQTGNTGNGNYNISMYMNSDDNILKTLYSGSQNYKSSEYDLKLIKIDITTDVVGSEIILNGQANIYGYNKSLTCIIGDTESTTTTDDNGAFSFNYPLDLSWQNKRIEIHITNEDSIPFLMNYYKVELNSLTRLQELINKTSSGGTLNLTGKTFRYYPGDQSITINKTITINGDYDRTNGTVISTAGSSIITGLIIVENGYITANNIKFECGIEILSNYTNKLYNCDICNNNKYNPSTPENTSYGGGLIVGVLSQVNLDNTRIYNNVAHYGGGVYLRGNNSKITGNCQINDNYCIVRGGGLYRPTYSTFYTASTITNNKRYFDKSIIDNIYPTT